MMLTRYLMAMLLAACWVSPAPADQNDRRLDGLFAQLQSTGDQAEAAAIQVRIWGLWFQTEDEDINLLMRMGSVALNQGRYEAALTAFDRVVKQAPEFAEGWNRRATLHYLMGSYAASVRDVERTLALELRHFGALSGLGLINMRLGHNDQAIKAFREALKVNPHLSGAKANLEGLLGERT